MGLKEMLEKAGIVEHDEMQMPVVTPLEVEETVKVEVPNGTMAIEQIYAEIDMADMSKSIFKVEEFSANFPTSLPEAVRKQAVVGVLNTAGFPVDSLVADGQTRLSAINGFMDAMAESISADVQENVDQIAELNLQIENLKIEIIELNKLAEEQRKIVTAEATKIQSILDFVK